MTVVSTKNAEHYRWKKQCEAWHLLKSPQLSIIQERMPTGCSESKHYHERAEQFFYVLSGTASLEISGQTHTLAAQQGIHVRAGIAHRLFNAQPEDLEFLVVSSPPSHGDRTESPDPEKVNS